MEGVEVHGGQFIHDGSEYLVNVVNGPGWEIKLMEGGRQLIYFEMRNCLSLAVNTWSKAYLSLVDNEYLFEVVRVRDRQRILDGSRNYLW